MLTRGKNSRMDDKRDPEIRSPKQLQTDNVSTYDTDDRHPKWKKRSIARLKACLKGTEKDIAKKQEEQITNYEIS